MRFDMSHYTADFLIDTVGYLKTQGQNDPSLEDALTLAMSPDYRDNNGHAEVREVRDGIQRLIDEFGASFPARAVLSGD